MLFSTDEAKIMKKITAVKRVSLLISARNRIKRLSPDDEMTLYLYTGTKLAI